MLMNEPVCCPVCGRVLFEDQKALIHESIPIEGIQCPYCKNKVFKAQKLNWRKVV